MLPEREVEMRKKSLRVNLLVFATVSVIIVSTSFAETITFGIYTSDKPTAMYQKFKPIIDYLQSRITQNGSNAMVKMKIFPSYAAAVDALVEGNVDFARFGPASYIMARDRDENIRLLAMEHKKNRKRFYGVFIVAKNFPINSINELKGKSFAFGNKNSTIGRYLSQAELVKAGIRSADLTQYDYLGRHDKVALAVAVGNYDAGVVKENTFKKYAESKGLKKIAQFPNVTKPWAVRAGFDDNLFAILQQALLELKDKKTLKALKQDGFLVAEDSDYDFVRQGMRLSEEFGD
jgi:phosphonate transport system substrate-binding protein